MRIAFWFVISGAIWVLGSDVLLYRWVEDPQLLGRLETAKGWAFVAVAGVIVYLCSAHNLAVFQRSEALRRAIIDHLNDGIFLVGQAGDVIGVNPAMVRMLGVSSKEALLGLSATDISRIFRLTSVEGRLIAPEQYASQRSLRGEIVDTYTAVVHPLGRPALPITVTAAPVRATPDGPVELSVTVVRDVEVLEKLERMRDEFFASAAHALKTPMTTISLHAQLLADQSASEALQKVAGVINRQCARIDRLVQNLLVASRLRHGNLTFHMDQVELSSLALATAIDIGSREPGLALELEIEGQPRVFADQERLGLVLANLITQAHHMLDVRGSVKLQVTSTDDRARVSVAATRTNPEEQWSEAASPDLRARFDGAPDGSLELYVSDGILEGHACRLEKGMRGTDAWLAWFELPTFADKREGHA